MTQTNSADIEAARLLLARLGVSVTDLLATAAPPTAVPTFAEYVPIVSAAVGAGTRRVYSSYWNRLVEHWGQRHLDEPTPTEIRQLTETLKTALIVRRNARGGRSATEHFIAALRCIYTNAENDGLINPGSNPAIKVAKPRRFTSTDKQSQTHNSPKSTRSPPPPETTPPSTASSSDSTPKPPADAAAH
ncbi:hypothetical protein [Kribbella sp. NPDC023855]|uniref:hypothetical protein n=1 Tax=Kribbella sp. NPDC023855 TaxID=3154698 RepID=UPI0033F5646E